MEISIMEIIGTNGLWAGLFVALLFWVLKQNDKRESRYQEIIDKLTEKFEQIEEGIKSVSIKTDNLNSKND